MRSVLVGIFNLLFALAAAPLVDGILRQVKARLHSRRGPSIFQTYLDLGKLMVKDDQAGANNTIFSLTPIVCFASVLLAALFIPMGGVVPLGFAGDTLVLMYILTIAPLCVCLGGMASGSPYAYVGVSREIMTLMVVEPVMVMSLIASAVKAHSLMLADCIRQPLGTGPTLSFIICGVAFFLALQPEVAKVPFDQAEAEQEIMEGPLIEYSGRKLAMLKWSFYSKQIVLITLFTEWFLPWPALESLPLRMLCTVLKVLVVAVLVEVIAQVFPRLKISQSMRYFVSVNAFALSGLMLAVIGL